LPKLLPFPVKGLERGSPFPLFATWTKPYWEHYLFKTSAPVTAKILAAVAVAAMEH
jgi:hypothetical protein